MREAIEVEIRIATKRPMLQDAVEREEATKNIYISQDIIGRSSRFGQKITSLTMKISKHRTSPPENEETAVRAKAQTAQTAMPPEGKNNNRQTITRSRRDWRLAC